MHTTIKTILFFLYLYTVLVLFGD